MQKIFKFCLKTGLILAIIANLSGCAELRRKFVRKKQPMKEEPFFYSVQKYGPKSPHESYQDHYILWRNWHMDLERRDYTSYRRDITALEESLKHLTAMRDLLAEDKAEELNAQIEDMEQILAQTKKRRRGISEEVHSQKTAEKVGRIVINNFTYGRMKDYIVSAGEPKEGENK